MANWLLGDFGCHVACEKFMNPTSCTEGTECNPISYLLVINMTSRWNPSWTPWQEWNRLRPWPIVEEVSIHIFKELFE